MAIAGYDAWKELVKVRPELGAIEGVRSATLSIRYDEVVTLTLEILPDREVVDAFLELAKRADIQWQQGNATPAVPLPAASSEA